MATKSECSLLIKESLKDFFGEKDSGKLEDQLAAFDSDMARILDRAHREGVSPVEAMKMANTELSRKIKQKARKSYLQQNVNKLNQEYKNQPAFKGKPELAAEALLTNQEGVKYTSNGNIYGTREAIQNLSLGMLHQELRHIPGALKKVQSGKYDLDVKRVISGEVDEAELGRMDPVIPAYAKAARKLQDYLHQRKIESGMDVGYVKNRISGQRHNAAGMIRVGEENWKEIAKASFDWGRMGVEDADAYLDKMWKTVTEDEGKKMFRIGDDMSEILFNTSGKKMEKGRSVHFKGAKSSHDYSIKINDEKSLMQSLLMEVERDTGKIAAAEHLGPNFRLGWEKLTEDVDTGGFRGLEKKYEVAVHGTRGGGTNLGASAVSIFNKISDMSKLGTALLSTGTDLAFGPGVISSSTGKNYLQSVGDTLSNILQSSTNPKASALYMHTNLVDTLDSTFTGRINEDGAKTNWFSKMHNLSMKATGLPAQSQLFRASYAIQFGRDLFSMKDTSYSKLPRESLNRFDKYGIGEKEWDIMRTEGLDKLPDGREVINSGKLAEISPSLFTGTKGEKIFARNKLATNLNALMTELSEVASPTPNSSTMAWRDGTDPDSLIGMGARATGKYKSFIMSIPKTLQAIKGDEWNAKSVTNLSSVIITATTLKYSIDYLKAIATDRDPPDHTDPQVWAKAAMTSGAGGIVSDFLAQDFGSSPFSSMAEFLGGPGVDVAQDVYSVVSGSAQYVGAQVMGDKKSKKKSAKRALRDAEKITPTLPFMKNTINKNLYDSLHLLMNTGAKR